MSEDIEAKLHSMYRNALSVVSSGTFDPASIRMVREGVHRGYIGWREATRAGMALLETPEIERAMECLYDVVKGINLDLTVSYILGFVNDGVLDQHEVQLAIDEGAHAAYKSAAHVRRDRGSERRARSHLNLVLDKLDN